MVMVRAWAWMPLLLGLACVACLAGSAFFAYQTGCAADLKTGGVGNIQLAFHYGDLGAGCFLAGMLCGAAGILLLNTLEQSARLTWLTLFMLVGGTAFYLLALDLEALGVRHCLMT